MATVSPDGSRWTALVPMKALPAAKSRLFPMSDDVDAHGRLVRAMRADTLAALDSAMLIARIVVVVDRPDDDYPDAFVQSAVGLNAGLHEAATDAARRWPRDGVVAVVDVRPAQGGKIADDVLSQLPPNRRGFVPDADGTGTTLLAAPPGLPLGPQFGWQSAERHRESARALPGADGLRCDVDTPDDLRRAAAVGLGPRTRCVLEPAACG